jgi:hypothetical protein
MFARRIRLAVLVAVLALTAPAAARADSVTDWNLHASNALIRDAGQGATALPHLAMVHGAVYDAVNAIDRRYEPYLTAPPARRWYSKDAAVATAAHHVLVNEAAPLVTAAQRPALLALIEPAYAAALAAIPDGRAKEGGIATGAAAAEAMIAARTGDGRFGPFRFTIGTTPGAWRPTPPGFVNDPGAWLKDTKPFLVESASQFPTRGPRALTSRRYAREFAEVKALGSAASSTRTADQTAAAQYWGLVNPVGTWCRIFRLLADQHGLSTADSARYYAMLHLTTADGAINTWYDKTRWSFWRPITAIHEAGTDGNRWTEPDPTWLPLITNPPYPEHPSGLTTLAGAAVTTLQQFFRTDRVGFTDTAGTVTRSFERLSDVKEDVIDARVWSGIHFRTGDVAGARIGERIARWRAHRYFEPLRHWED